MKRFGPFAAAAVIASLSGMPAAAQPYGYGAPPPPPPPPGYGPPPPPPYAPPGAHCSARFENGQPLLCRMRVAKPVGAPCRCIAAAPPGYAPEPPVPGEVVP